MLITAASRVLNRRSWARSLDVYDVTHSISQSRSTCLDRGLCAGRARQAWLESRSVARPQQKLRLGARHVCKLLRCSANDAPSTWAIDRIDARLKPCNTDGARRYLDPWFRQARHRDSLIEDSHEWVAGSEAKEEHEILARGMDLNDFTFRQPALLGDLRQVGSLLASIGDG